MSLSCLVFCVHCSGVTVAPELTHGLILRGWEDLPLPAGWEWRETLTLSADKRTPNLHPVCPQCCQAWDRDPEVYYGRMARARDLVSIDGQRTLAGGRRRG